MASHDGVQHHHTFSLGQAATDGSPADRSLDDHPVTTALMTQPLEPAPGVIVHSGRSRQAAAETWLLLAAPDRCKALVEWEREGLTLLRCGGLFSAVRIPAAVVHAAAGTEDPYELTAILRQALDGPVFYDRSGRHFYALTPHSTARLWQVPESECLGPDFFLGVPATSVTAPDPRCRAWWVVPMDGPATLCFPAAVAGFVQRGRSLITTAQAKQAADA
ncbi:hypothetical protein ACFVIY_40240 [Streptomyces sp. NPDC127166]|uniref:hypothetical protein n=1 Tax=Streptomyces sp. NPDC127166 TaxID=3345380 RepID=UPI0036380384